MTILLAQLDRLAGTPGGMDGLRLLVEIHIGADLTRPFFFTHTLPSLLLIRARLRAAGYVRVQYTRIYYMFKSRRRGFRPILRRS